MRYYHQSLQERNRNAALTVVQKIYKIEAKAREGMFITEQRKELSLQESLPILNEFRKWLVKQLKDGHVLPKSPLGKAIQYSLNRWNQFNAILYDGILEPDNNKSENIIRPLALGLKTTCLPVLMMQHKDLQLCTLSLQL